MSMGPAARPVTPLAEPLGLDGAVAVDDDEVARHLHPIYRAGVARFPRGPLVSRGLPFVPAGAGSERRWIVLDEPIRIDLAGTAATHLVLLHFCDAWRDADDRRPPGVPVGWVLPVGEPLAQARVRRTDGSVVETTLRRRFEVNEGIIGWGSMAFLALPHLAEEPLDWRGPHARQSPARYAPAGHSGPLTTLPGTWGASQTGVGDNVPSGDDDLMLWLHAIDVRGADGASATLETVELRPLPGEGNGRLVVLAAMTAFRGASSPLRWLPRRGLRVSGGQLATIDVDMGLIARRAPMGRAPLPATVSGWGEPLDHPSPADGPEIVELTAAADGALIIDGERLLLSALGDAGSEATLSGPIIEALPPADQPIRVLIREAGGRPTPARVRIHAPDGRVLPPRGHRLEVNPGLYEDSGADLLLGGVRYSYVDDAFDVDVPADGAWLEVVRGFDISPVRVDIGPGDLARGTLEVRLGEAIQPRDGRWVSGDTHVHFLAPSTALLQARAEGVNVVHLLATQWGDHHTGVTDLGGDLVHPAGEHAVWVGSENRQNMLGHVGIVGTSRPVLPFSSGGPPEGPIGNPVTHLMADWLKRCRELGGLAIGAHFPLPMAEVAADIEAGLLDALELQCFDLALESPPIREWYRYLDAGYRLPLVGGTDKMSAEVPLGQIRTWARLDDDVPLSFAGWAAALRAGRTFVSSGPILELTVEGHGPGEVLSAPRGATLEIEVAARAAQPIIGAVELVVNGVVVAERSNPEPVADLVLREQVRVERSGWLAGRSRSPHVVGSAFASAMAAHTSPVYVEVPGSPRAPADLTISLVLVDGTRAWLEALAPVADESAARRFGRFLDEAEQRLRERMS